MNSKNDGESLGKRSRDYRKICAAIQSLNAQSICENNFGHSSPAKPKKEPPRWFYLDPRRRREAAPLLPLILPWDWMN